MQLPVQAIAERGIEEFLVVDHPYRLRTFPAHAQTNVEWRLKRFFDVCLSSLLLMILIPTLFPIVAIIILLDSRGSIFFIQPRTGLNQQTFSCLKFRTMIDVPKGLKRSVEERITPLGMMLRRSHIDELPQLVNVLMGHMSLVGPRPHMLSDNQQFERSVTNYQLRHAVRPGITGLAQVSGFYGTVDSAEHLTQRVRLDIEYVYTWNTKRDTQILLRTLVIPFRDLF